MVAVALFQWRQAKRINQPWMEEFDGFQDDQPIKDWLGMSGAFFIVMGGFRAQTCEPDLVTTICPSGFEELLEKKILHQSIRKGKLTAAHFLSRNIEDKGKADGVAKFLVILQILWMAIQCLGRKLTGLPVTLLEYHVLIQILYSIVAYGFWWHKPLDVAEPIVLTLDTVQLSKLGLNIRHVGGEFSVYPKFITEQRYRGGIARMFFRTAYDIGVNAVYEFKANTPNKAEALAAAVGIISGGLHAIAWNSHFPTETERLLWRISSIGIGLTLLMLLLLVRGHDMELYAIWATYNHRFCDDSFRHQLFQLVGHIVNINQLGRQQNEESIGLPTWLPIWARCLQVGAGCLCILGYVISIAYLTVEAYVSVRSLPEGAYSSVEWLDFFPHF
ncbi:hypothetical protein F5883DRAFT_500108 [Diaporthe sp. PMI_573]|nr:hypothetical protein F5883DRAFT_500108 [Diaporthaceae sp. PMI_573]